MSEYNRHKFAMEWMHGGGRDPNGRGLDEEIQIANDMWKEFNSKQAQLLPEEWDDLTPKEERYYQQGTFSTHEDFRGAKGGTVPQLVQPGPGRPGYAGRYTDPNYSKKYYKKNKPALKKAASEWYEKNKARVADYPLLDREATKIEKGPRKGQYRYSLAGKKDPITGERVGETYYFKSKEKLQEFKKKRYETAKLSKQKQAKVIGK